MDDLGNDLDYAGDDAATLDANAVGGVLFEIFGSDLTGSVTRCAHCGNQGPVGTLRAYVNAPGIVLRCSICAGIVMRLAPRPDGTYSVDARGAAFIRM